MANKVSEARLKPMLFTIAEVARATAFSKAQLYRDASSNTLGTVRRGRAIRVPAAALDAYLRDLGVTS